MHGGFGFGFDGPGAGDVEAGLDEADGEGVPGVVGFVGEHYDHDAVVFDDAAAFAEDLVHFVLVVLGGEGGGGDVAAVGVWAGGFGLALEAGGAGDGFVDFVG